MLKTRVRPSGLWFIWITLIVFVADWSTKELANSFLEPYVPVPVSPFFNLTLAYNNGAAFSFLDTASLWPNILFGLIALAVSVVILLWLARLPRNERALSIGLTLILGGALGNLWSRIRYEHVIDFVDLYVRSWHWPVFNVADMAVSLGVFLIVCHWMSLKK